MGSPGMDKVRWHRPVRPGDAIRCEVEVRALRPSDSKTDRGYGTFAYMVLNQDDEIVMTFTCTQILRRRPELPRRRSPERARPGGRQRTGGRRGAGERNERSP